jgi:hypothetical protein
LAVRSQQRQDRQCRNRVPSALLKPLGHLSVQKSRQHGRDLTLTFLWTVAIISVDGARGRDSDERAGMTDVEVFLRYLGRRIGCCWPLSNNGLMLRSCRQNEVIEAWPS